jgi:hypothetical protein
MLPIFTGLADGVVPFDLIYSAIFKVHHTRDARINHGKGGVRSRLVVC